MLQKYTVVTIMHRFVLAHNNPIDLFYRLLLYTLSWPSQPYTLLLFIYLSSTYSSLISIGKPSLRKALSPILALSKINNASPERATVSHTPHTRTHTRTHTHTYTHTHTHTHTHSFLPRVWLVRSDVWPRYV